MISIIINTYISNVPYIKLCANEINKSVMLYIYIYIYIYSDLGRNSTCTALYIVAYIADVTSQKRTQQLLEDTSNEW